MRAEAVSNTTTVITSGAKKLVAVPWPFATFSPFFTYKTNRDIHVRLTSMGSATSVNVIEHERPTPLLTAASTDRLTARNTDHGFCPKAATRFSGVRHTHTGGPPWIQIRAPGAP